jgi:hydrogenase expression/formation protein HypE
MGIESNIHSDCAYLIDVVSSLFKSGAHVKAMRDVTRGGLATVTNELAAASGCKICLWEDTLPVMDNVAAFCALMGLDPLYMGNEGNLAVVVKEQDAEKALHEIRKTEHGRRAAIIGEVMPCSSEYGRSEVVLRTRLGGHRRLDILMGEGLPRIC